MPPLRRRRIQHSDNPICRAHEGISIVFDVIAPMTVRNKAVHFSEVSAKQLHQVDHVNALIEQHPAAGNFAFGTPVRLVESDQFCLAVDAAHVDDAAKLAGP